MLQDHQTGRFHRLSPSANLMMSLMDGRRTIAEIWDLVGQRSGDDPPTQDETIALLSQLHSSDLLQGEMPPDFDELGERASTTVRRNLLSRVRNPLALRLPLWDPDKFLEATMPLVRPFFTVWAFLAWLALVGTGIVLAILNWTQLSASGSEQVFSLQNIVFIAAIYPVIKTLHEAGHAYATKAFGGSVHEVGIMLLIMIPAPYVDATSATAFRQKWRRVIVSGAGIMVEFALAAIAMIFWLNAEPGFARAASFNVMLIGGISTLLFNGNPLLRFDAYYILADLIEVPNLGARANKYFWYLAQRYWLGHDTAENPAVARGERKWLFWYAVISFLYRTVLSLTIATLVATKLFFVGVILALFTVAGTFVMPVFKGAKYVLTSPKLHDHRTRAVLASGGLVVALLALFFVIPMPYGTVAQGVVWIPQRTEVVARSSGIVSEVLATPDSVVHAGDPLLQIEDPTLTSRLSVLQAQRQEFVLRYDAVRFTDRVQADVLLEQARHIDGTLASLTERRDALLIRATLDGRFILPNATDLQGRFVEEGELIGYVVADETPGVRVVVPQSDVDLVRGRTDHIDLRYASNLDTDIRAQVVRAVPAAQFDLPSLALSVQGGGSVVLDGSGQQPRALEGIFVFDLVPERTAGPLLLGSRVYVRFDHGQEAFGWRLLRAVRQIFLSTFDV